MPKRTDIKKILIIGSGPIVIGQGCEFDYSGAQACKALRQEGYKVVLVNSNPATIMTDPSMADATYIEPIKWQYLEKIIEKEKPDALLPTMGGQTGLNCALDLAKRGILEKYNVEMIGASREAIDKAEDRELFRQAMHRIGLRLPKSAIAHSIEEAKQLQRQMGFPTIIRPSFTLGGSGGGIAYNIEEFVEICARGLSESPTHEVLVEESIIGWKEFELEVVRDCKDNCIVVCAIENLDPMGIHTGDSITVAPAQTLTDKEYQQLRDASFKVMREIGVDTGGSNVQFGVNPKNGEIVVIEMNPRVSRSSALASKATGFPIAKVAAKLAVGYTLDELKNDITGGAMPASFEPTIDYVVTKIPRFDFEKFPSANAVLTTQMKSVGETMAMGRNFAESLQKALQGLEVGIDGFSPIIDTTADDAIDQIKAQLKSPGALRILYVAEAFRTGMKLEEVAAHTKIDLWFLAQISNIVALEQDLSKMKLEQIDAELMYYLKQQGFSDSRIATILNQDFDAVTKKRQQLGVKPVFKRVDTCAAEFEAATPYLYSSYDEECEAHPSNNKDKIIILGGGPNRIGQGIEFDYCCVHAVFALKDLGYETILVNCNPETVSTDYDTADRLYFEPLTLEHVLNIVALEQPKGVIVQYGGQTPLKLAKKLEEYGVPIIGTSPTAIDAAEDRDKFQALVNKLNLLQPKNGIAMTVEQGLGIAKEIGYPLVVRPSYVLGGRAIEIVYKDEDLLHYLQRAFMVSGPSPVLMDKYLEQAIEIDVDAVCDGKDVFIAGIMEHIEQAGIHSGDSSCSLPHFSLKPETEQLIRKQITNLALEIGVNGLINAQFALQQGKLYILEVNPRASRTVPFVSKATGIDVAKIAAKCMVGISLEQQNYAGFEPKLKHYAVKQAVFPFSKFTDTDPILGPEMRSTGEVMGLAKSFGAAYAKAEFAVKEKIVPNGKIFLSVKDSDKNDLPKLAQEFVNLGFHLVATEGTAKAIEDAGISCERVNKIIEGRPHVVDLIKNKEIAYIVNTTEGRQAIADSFYIRQAAVQNNVRYTTTIAGALATLAAIVATEDEEVYCLQQLHV